MKRSLIIPLLVFISSFAIGQDQVRTPLFEMFTSSTCPPCNQGNKDLSKAFEESNGNWVCVKYQMYFPGVGDPYFTDEGYTRSKFYTLTGVPQLHIDGTNEIYPGALTNEMVQDIQAVPALVNLNATKSIDERKIDISVSLDPNQNVITPFLKLFVAIVENKTYNNVATNGETQFEFVMKKMLPDAGGTQLPLLKEGEPLSFDFTYEFNGDYRLPNDSSDPIDHELEHSVEEFTDISVVVWAQNRITKEVLQSTWATFPVGTEKLGTSDNGIISMFPNPSKNFINLHYQVKNPSTFTLSIFDLEGRELSSIDLGHKDYGNFIETINLSTYPTGHYLIQLESEMGIFQHQFIKTE